MRRLLVLVAALALLPGVARAADETTQYLLNVTHTSSVADSPLKPPLKLRWRADLGHVRSNVLVFGGRVFYVRSPGTGAELTALNAADGSVAWSQDGAGVRGIAADGGRLFVLSTAPQESDDNVVVRALDPATGGQIWARTIQSAYGPGSHPTATDGQLFFIESSGSSRLYALKQSDGTNLWPPKSLSSGDSSAPAVDADSVYVSLAGHQTYAFRRADGVQRWHSEGCCSGGGGTTPVLHNGVLYGDGGLMHRTSDGLIVGDWRWRPAWSGELGVSADDDGRLRGIGPDYATTRWTRDVEYGSAGWLIAGDHVYVGTGFYGRSVQALRLSDGAEVWCTNVELPPGSWTGSSSDEEVLPQAVGDGLLLVEQGYGLAAYESGGASSSCDAGTSSPAPQPTNPTSPGFTSRPALDLDLEWTSVFVGERVTVGGQIQGMPITAGQEVVAELDEWPFEGSFRAAGSDRASDGGFVSYTLRPRRNVRVRLRLGSDTSVASVPETVWADFPTRIVRRGRGGPRPRVDATLYALPGADVRRRVVHGYLLRRGWKEWRRVASQRWRRVGRVSSAVTLRYPRGALGRRDRVLLCTREATPDGYGQPTPYDRLCGARRMPRTL